MEKAMIKIAVLKGYNAFQEHKGEGALQGTWKYLEKEFPEVVNTGNDGYKSVAYGTMTAILVEAVKELKVKNDNLKYKIKFLQEGLNNL